MFKIHVPVFSNLILHKISLPLHEHSTLRHQYFLQLTPTEPGTTNLPYLNRHLLFFPAILVQLNLS